MKHKFAGITLIIMLTLTAGAFNSSAEDGGPTAAGSMSFLSKYMWRGYEMTDDSIVVQPSMTIEHKGLGFNAWGNLDTDPADENAALTETDLTVFYDTGMGPVGLGAGYIYYGFDGMADTQEFYLKASYATLFTPTLTIYKDVSTLPGYYCSLGLSHSISLTDEVALNLSGAFGYYTSEDDSIDYSGLQDGLLTAALSIPITKYISLSPTASYAFPLSDEAEESLGITGGVTFGGVVLSISF